MRWLLWKRICLTRDQVNTNSPERSNDPVRVIWFIPVELAKELAQESRESIFNDSLSDWPHKGEEVMDIMEGKAGNSWAMIIQDLNEEYSTLTDEHRQSPSKPDDEYMLW